jgi:valyl-tRNA synthetase
MIMAGQEYQKEIPFKNVYLTGIVRDKLGRKMSKSLGNSPDPIELMEKYGADGVRVGMLFSSPAGNDLPFDEGLCEQGRNFSNKLWNAFRLVKGWEVANIEQPQYAKVSIEWFEAKLNNEIAIIEDHFSKYRISDALMSVYKLVWDDYCSWFLEMIKPAYQQPIDKATFDSTILIFEKIIKLLHPFMPFITEEIWHLVAERTDKECLMISPMPEAEKFDAKIIEKFESAIEVIIAIRNVRKEKNLPNKDAIDLFIKKNFSENSDLTFDNLVQKMCNLSTLEYVENKIEGAFSFTIKNTEFFIPVGTNFNAEEEIAKIEEELKYTKGFLESVTKKLSNESFANNAPAKVVEIEKKKQSDAEDRIKILEEQLLQLKG